MSLLKLEGWLLIKNHGGVSTTTRAAEKNFSIIFSHTPAFNNHDAPADTPGECALGKNRCSGDNETPPALDLKKSTELMAVSYGSDKNVPNFRN